MPDVRIILLSIYLLKAQAGWLQHDLGHVSAFSTNELNHLMQRVTLSTLKVII